MKCALDPDHNVISLLIRTKDIIIQRQEILRRSFKNLNKQRALDKMKDMDWSELLASDDVNIVYNILETKILEVLDDEAPLKVIQIKKNQKNWISKELHEMMKDRDRKRERARITGDQRLWQEYKLARNNVTKITRKVKNEYYTKVYEKLAEEKDTKNIYKMTKDLCGWKVDNGPRTFLQNGILTRKPRELADIQVRYYHDKIEKLMQKLRGNIHYGITDPIDRLEKALRKWDGRDSVPIFNFRQITQQESVTFVKKLGNSYTFGYDGIDANFVKLILPSIIIPLTHTINTSLKSGIWANKWKISRTFPSLKKQGIRQTITSIISSCVTTAHYIKDCRTSNTDTTSQVF